MIDVFLSCLIKIDKSRIYQHLVHVSEALYQQQDIQKDLEAKVESERRERNR